MIRLPHVATDVARSVPNRLSRVSGAAGLPRTLAILALVIFGLSSVMRAQTATPVNVPTWRYDNTHEGQNTQETLLTPSNVTAGSFGKLFSVPVDGYVYAQPLYMSGLTMGDGLVHNVVFVATEHDSVYAFDADTNGGDAALPLWHANLTATAYGAAPGATTVANTDLGVIDITPEVGITGTPAINPATNTLYVVAKTAESGGYVQRLHALNIITGAEQPGSPVVISGSVPGTGTGSSGGVLTFDTLWQNQRPALNYNNGYVYIGYGAHGDDGPWHGWVFAYNATTLQQTAIYCTSANGLGNGVWGSGAGLPIDSGGTAGRMYISTGNGTFAAYPPLSSGEFANSVVQLDLSNGGLNPTDAWTAYNTNTLTASDQDQGSGGVLLLPTQQGPYPDLLVQAGKDANIEVINRDNMGGYASGASSNTNLVQEIINKIKGMWSTPAYWNGNIYTWANDDYPRAFSVTNGVLSSSPTSYNLNTYSQYPGASFVVSSNGTQNGIVWGVRTDQFPTSGSEVLYAFNATNLQELYESDTVATDNAGLANKFVVPVVTNGKVYVGAAYQLNVYGLLGSVPTAAAPVITPGTANYSAATNVSIASTTPNATIYYTIDGSTPTVNSMLYTGPITVSGDTVVNAIASAQGYLQSAVSSATFTFPAQTPQVSFTPAAGIYSTAQQISLADADPNATIYYTTNGSTPTTSSTPYTGPITVSSSMTINAIAQDGANPISSIASSAYMIETGQTAINFPVGFSNVNGLKLNGSVVNSDDSRLQLTNGGTFEKGSVYYATPVNIQNFVTNFSFQISDAVENGFTFTIQNAGVTALGLDGAGLGYGSQKPTGGIPNSVAIKFDFYNSQGEGYDSTGLYEDGLDPTVPAIDMTPSGVILSSGDAIYAQISYDGTNLTLTLNDVIAGKSFTHQFPVNIPAVVGSNTAYVGFTGATGSSSASQKILTWTFSSTPTQSAAPTFSPTGGTYSTAQSVTLSSTTPGATIYYTTDGSTPSGNSAKYTGPIAVNGGTTTINAMAQTPGYLPSTVSSATYTVTITPPPSISPAGGNYSTAPTVTLTDTNPSAVIYYTMDGSTPTTSSLVYGGPIVLPAGATTTINAIAAAPSLSQSSMVGATYTVASYFTLTPNVSSLTVASTLPGSVNLTVNPGPGFTGTPTFTATGFPTGVTGILTPTSSATGTVLSITALATTKPGTYPIVVTGVSGTLKATTTISLVIPSPTPSPVFTPLGKTYSTPQTLTLTDSAASATIYYTTDGSTPTTASAVFSAAINIPTGTTVVNAFAVNNANSVPSPIVSGTFQVMPPVPVISPTTQHSFTTSQNVTITDAATGATIYYTTNGTVPTAATGTVYTGPIALPGGTTPFEAIAVVGSATSNVGVATYVITLPPPVLSPVGNTYGTTQNVTMTDTVAGSSIYYTTNGTAPTPGTGTLYTAPVQVTTGTTVIEAIAVNGSIQSAVTTATYSVTLPAPTFTPVGGTYGVSENVTLADSYAGAAIYYTTNGTAPTTSSTPYSGPIPVTVGTTVIEAIAVSGSLQSPVATATYNVSLQAPVISTASKTSPVPFTVTLTDAASTATIYYTTNGTAPTAASTPYTGPISITAGTTTLEAIAVLGSSMSGVSTATYTVTVAAPAISPAGNSYSTPQNVTITDTYTGATIYYTTNGTTPTTASSIYTAAIPVTGGVTTVEAIAVAGATQSSLSTATYSVTPTAPVIGPATHSSTTAITVTITDAATTASIYYTTDGTTPTTASTLYTGPIQALGGVTTIKAIAVAGTLQSPLSSAIYTVTLPVPVLSPGTHNYSTAQSVTLTDSVAGATFYYTLNGSTPTTSSTLYTGAIPVGPGTTVLNAIAVVGQVQSAVASATYTIAPPAPTFTPAAGSYTSVQTVTIADSDTAATIYYTTNGTTPTVNSSVYNGPITVGAGTTGINAIAAASTTNLSAVAIAKYVVTLPASATPTVSPAAGSYVGAQTITLSDTQTGTIYYTTNGTTPTTASPVYTAPFTIAAGATTSVRAIQVTPGYAQSALLSAAYTLSLPLTPSPSFAPGGASFTGPQIVTMADSVNNAVIYYTTNGTTPTTASTVYSGPFTIGAGTTKVQAFAQAPGYSASKVVATSYTVTLPGTKTKTNSVSLSQPESLETGHVVRAAYNVKRGIPVLSADYDIAADGGEMATGNADIAAEPSMKPIPGFYKKSLAVALTSKTPDAAIHYTVDGAQPTLASPICKAPIVILGHALTIKAFTAAPGKKDSPVVTGTYHIESR